MELRYLGTAAAEGWPALFCKCDYCKKAKELGGKNIRTRPQAVIDNQLLIDLPADTYFHYLTYDFDLPNTENLLITHSHSDHFYPMELEMRCEPYMMQNSTKLQIFGNKTVEKSYRGVENYEPRIKSFNNFNSIEPFKIYDIGKYNVVAILANHDEREDCFNYIVESKNDNKVLLYAHDTGFYGKETWDYLTENWKLDAVSIDCTSGYEDDGNNHLGFNDSVKFKQLMIDANLAGEDTKFIISHFSHNGRYTHEELVEKAAEHNMLVAYDGMSLKI